jgi:hypothetical protein
MSDEHTSDSGIDIALANEPSPNAGRDFFIDPDSVPGDTGGTRANAGDGSEDAGRTFADGFGAAGEFGRGRFPDGRSRKRSAYGSRAQPGAGSGTENVSENIRPRKASRSVNASGIEYILLSLHAGVSAVVEQGYEDKIIPLQEDDAKRLSVAIANVAKYYPELQTTGKIADHIALMIAAASIYGPITARLYMRSKEAKPKPNKGPAVIYDFPPGGPIAS